MLSEAHGDLARGSRAVLRYHSIAVRKAERQCHQARDNPTARTCVDRPRLNSGDLQVLLVFTLQNGVGRWDLHHSV